MIYILSHLCKRKIKFYILAKNLRYSIFNIVTLMRQQNKNKVFFSVKSEKKTYITRLRVGPNVLRIQDQILKDQQKERSKKIYYI